MSTLPEQKSTYNLDFNKSIDEGNNPLSTFLRNARAAALPSLFAQ